MSAQVIMLFGRGIVARNDNTRAELLAKVRMIAHGRGCNGAQRAIVVGAADHWLDLGIPAPKVLERARAKALQLVSPDPDGGAAA